MVETGEYIKGLKEGVKERAAKIFLIGAIAFGGVGSEADAQKGEINRLEQYGKIVLYNATEEEGGTRGYGGIVYDKMDERALLCTVEHVAKGGPNWDDVFNEKMSGGDDPIVCTEINEFVGKFENVPIISTDPIDVGDEISVVSDNGEAVDFNVIRTEDDRVWFVPQDPDNWTPKSGDSGSLVGRIEDETTFALGVYGG